MKSTSLTFSARYVFPVEGEPIRNGALSIRDGRIDWIGRANERLADFELGNVAIVPGFVNAHTHLELSPVERASTGESENEVDWLRRVIAQRRGGGTREAIEGVVARNLSDCIAYGTTTLADTTTAGLSWAKIAEAPVRSVVFSELIGLKRSRGLETAEQAWSWLATIQPEDQVSANARPGLSPHAPYSTAGWLYYKAAGSRLPLSTHLAEMPEELELLEKGTGPLRSFLEDLGAWDPDWEPVGGRPADYVRRGDLRKADWLIAHGTYFDPSEFWQLLPQSAPDDHRVAVAYCPRTHARFGHAPHPFRAMLERGVVVCLGTDSLASNPSLSVLDEIRFLFQRDTSLGGPLLLAMATLFGAWALRAEKTSGSLVVGKSADLAIVALPDRDEADPHRLILDSEHPVAGTVFEGKAVSGRWDFR